MRTFRAGDRTVRVTHLWKTRAYRGGYAYRLCRLVGVSGDGATIRLSGSGRKRQVPAASLIDLETVNPKYYELSL